MLYLIGHVDTVAAWDIEEYAAVEEWRKMSLSRAGFVVPDRCEALIDLHLSPSVNPGEVRRELEALRLTALQQFRQLAQRRQSLRYAIAGQSHALQLITMVSTAKKRRSTNS